MAGPDPTQAKVVAALETFTNYSSDYVAPINPAGEEAGPHASRSSQVKGGKWQKTYPAGAGFAC